MLSEVRVQALVIPPRMPCADFNYLGLFAFKTVTLLWQPAKAQDIKVGGQP